MFFFHYGDTVARMPLTVAVRSGDMERIARLVRHMIADGVRKLGVWTILVRHRSDGWCLLGPGGVPVATGTAGGVSCSAPPELIVSFAARRERLRAAEPQRAAAAIRVRAILRRIPRALCMAMQAGLRPSLYEDLMPEGVRSQYGQCGGFIVLTDEHGVETWMPAGRALAQRCGGPWTTDFDARAALRALRDSITVDGRAAWDASAFHRDGEVVGWTDTVRFTVGLACPALALIAERREARRVAPRRFAVLDLSEACEHAAEAPIRRTRQLAGAMASPDDTSIVEAPIRRTRQLAGAFLECSQDP